MLRVSARAASLAVRRPARAWLLMRMAGWIIALSALVKFWSLPRALQFVAPGETRRPSWQPISESDLSAAIDAVLGINVLALKPTCWKRAAVLHRYLALNGVSTRIIFGVKREEGELKGHAWLERDGQPILESSPPSYVVTYSFPSDQPFEVDLTVLADTRPGE